ncbi:MAG: tail fiber domain-containing protein [Ferruginibacter sp.]
MKLLSGFLVLLSLSASAQVGKVGINTNQPLAMLHVKDSSVLFSGSATIPAIPGLPPASGSGSRMMWYADKAAFRAGAVTANAWDKDNIGQYSFAAGRNTIASDNYATAFGYFTQASGNYATALGNSSIASGPASIALGNNALAAGGASMAIGDFTGAYGYASFAAGSSSFAYGETAACFGNNVTAKSFASFSIGQYNLPFSSGSENSWVTTDPVLVIGNGTSNAARNNALTILKNANTGINVPTPAAALHIKGTAATFDSHLRLETYGSSTDYMNLSYDGSTKFKNFGTDDEYQFRNDENLIICRMQDNGNMVIAGTLTQNSDARLKKDIMPLEGSLQKLMQLNGYHYRWKAAGRDNELQTGLLAQEVAQQMPELVNTDEEGTKSVNYNGLIPYLLEAVKELKKENEYLKKQIEKISIRTQP